MVQTTRKQIEVTKEVREKIKAAFKCSEATVWRALNFQKESALAARIQKYALLSGGTLLTISPAVETIHDSDGMMRQYFPNGAAIEADKGSGTVCVYDSEGKKRVEAKNCTIDHLQALQNYAGGL